VPWLLSFQVVYHPNRHRYFPSPPLPTQQVLQEALARDIDTVVARPVLHNVHRAHSSGSRCQLGRTPAQAAGAHAEPTKIAYEDTGVPMVWAEALAPHITRQGWKLKSAV
jgi:hypothetical protein